MSEYNHFSLHCLYSTYLKNVVYDRVKQYTYIKGCSRVVKLTSLSGQLLIENFKFYQSGNTVFIFLINQFLLMLIKDVTLPCN